VRRLILVRHGESSYNAEGRIQGQRCAGLSELGYAQAKVTATTLAEAYPDARLVTSDLQRTRETAEPLAAALNTEPDEDARLRERSFGNWEGHLRVEVQRDDPGRWGRWLAGEDVIGEIGGETGAQLADRVVPVFRRLLSDVAEGGVIIAVTHGGPVWHGLHQLLDLDHPILGGVGNCSVTELGTIEGGTPRLLRWNETGHLPLQLREVWRAFPTPSDGPAVGH
jgi:glucosyl-3-phosphoglycerate phosphatase